MSSENPFEETLLLTGEEASILSVMASMTALISLIYLVAVGTLPWFAVAGGGASVILGALAAIGALRRRHRANAIIGGSALIVGAIALAVAGLTHL